jgi:cytochrome P450
LRLWVINCQRGKSLFPVFTFLAHYREEVYPKPKKSEPKKFNPECFLERQFSPYEYLPFVAGNRRCSCIGLAFAQYELSWQQYLQIFNFRY